MYGRDIYLVLKCPRFNRVNIIRYYWHGNIESDYDIIYTFLYQQNTRLKASLFYNTTSTFQSAN